MSVKSDLNKLYLYRLIANRWHQRVVKKNPRAEMERYYQMVFNRKPDIDKPKDLLEKIYWLTLYSDTSLWTICADKYKMREYVQKCGLADYLPKLFAKWDKAEDMDFEILPNEFILKTNNGCANNIIVRDKSIVNVTKIRKIFRRELNLPFGYSGAQLHYTKINPCIIAEELLHQGKDLDSISPMSLIDYKIWCFGGRPYYIWGVYNRTSDGMGMFLYDTQWNPHPEFLVEMPDSHYDPSVKIPKPECLGQMLEMAAILAKPFPQVRVDVYNIEGKPIIGELTFTTGYGYLSKELYLEMGQLIDLSKVKKINS